MNAITLSSTAFQDEISNYWPSDDTISSLPSRPTRVRVAQPTSRWAVDLKDRLNELTSLPKGWDGYVGQPVSFNCAQFAANLIERLYVNSISKPQLVPGADGTLQIEWHLNQFDLEIDVLAPYNVVATRFDHQTNQEEELEVQADFTELAMWVNALGQDRTNPQQMEN